MFDKYIISYIRAGMDDEKSIEKQVEGIQEYCDENDIISMGFYEEISDEITDEMQKFLKEKCEGKDSVILVASLGVLSGNLKKMVALVNDFKELGIAIESLNPLDKQLLEMVEK